MRKTSVADPDQLSKRPDLDPDLYEWKANFSVNEKANSSTNIMYVV
jgi:hypothetical protein